MCLAYAFGLGFVAGVGLTLIICLFLIKPLDSHTILRYIIDMQNEILPSNKEVAQTILSQIKALDYWFLARIGFNSASYSNNSLNFKVNGSKVGRADVKITLNSMDTYDITVSKTRKSGFTYVTKELGKSEDIYCDGLVDSLNYLVEGK